MTMKRILFALLFIGFGPAYAQQPGVTVTVKMGDNEDVQDMIIYNRKEPLAISDFQGRPYGPQMAMTNSGINMNYKWHSNGTSAALDVIITTTFDPSKSFFKDEGKNAYILNHEQRHFDITAIEACKLITAIENFHFTMANYKDELQAIYQKYQDERKEQQEEYDGETNHSIIRDQQDAWNKKIDAELKEQTCY